MKIKNYAISLSSNLVLVFLVSMKSLLVDKLVAKLL